MERAEIECQRPVGEWIVSVSMLMIPLPIFWFLYPRSGFENGNKALIYLLCLAVFLFIYGFYKTFLVPSSLRFEKDGFLRIKSLLLPKILPIGEIHSVRVTDTAGNKGPTHAIYEIILTDGDSVTLPPLTHMDAFIEKLTLAHPQVEMRDDRPHLKNE